MTEPSLSPDDAALQVPKRTTPTWEIELLISAGVVFTLFQLLEPLETSFMRWMAVASVSAEPVLAYGYLYAKVVLFTLAAAFVLNLIARAYWVSLVGLHSIYPQGVRWDNYSGGPIAREVARERSLPIAEAIERADNRASLVFATGVLCAQFALLLGIASLLLTPVLQWLDGLLPRDSVWLWVLTAMVVSIPLLATLLDRHLVPRLRPGHWLGGALRRLFQLGHRWPWLRPLQPLMPLLTTNLGGKRGPWLLVALIYIAIGAAFVDTMLRLGKDGLLRGDHFPELRREGGVHPAHYGDQREGSLRFSTAPWIPSEQATDDYLRLFVPYIAARHDVVLDGACATEAEPDPELAASERSRLALEQDQRRLRCFGEALQLRLDGQPLARVDFERHRDPSSDQDGLLAMIDIAGLARGRHQLELRRLAKRGGLFRKDSADEDDTPDRILFWR